MPAVAHGDPLVPGRSGYVEVTEAAGLGAFLHAGWLGEEGREGRPLFTEIAGPGACWIDYDDDGFLDLYLVNSLYQSFPEQNPILNPHSMMYRNNGDGTFTDSTSATGTSLAAIHMGCSAADYDNDADTDLFVSAWAGNVLFRNNGDGTFTDVAVALGVRDEDCGDFKCWDSTSSWLDYNRDGCLDLFVNRFGDFDDANPPLANAPGALDAQPNLLFEGSCGGAFLDATEAAGLAGELDHSWSSVSGDFNNDGWPDLWIANDGDPNRLYHNNQDGTFALKAITEADNDGRSGMGSAYGDFNHDNHWDLVTTNWVGQTNGIYQAAGNDYVSIGDNAPFTDADPWSGWAAHWFDINNDGQQDLMIVNGMTDFQDFAPLEHELLAYENRDGASFEIIRDDMGADFEQAFSGRGGAWGDYDNDGDMDLVVAEAGENPTHLFRADKTPGNFLNVDLVGTGAAVARDAVGARVKVSAAGLSDQFQEKAIGTGFLSSNDPRLHFGLATAESATVQVTWPGAVTQTWSDVPANAFVRLTQGDANVEVVKRMPIVRVSGPDEGERLVAQTFTVDTFVPDGAALSSVAWDFGDGGTGAGASASHAYTDIGFFPVKATVTDTLGRTKSQAFRILVTDQLVGGIDMDKPMFFPTDPARGNVTVSFADGGGVRDINVHLVVRYSTGNPTLDAALEEMPFFVQELFGYVTFELDGVTDAQGRWAFQAPFTIPKPSDFLEVEANHPGVYHMTATGGARHSAFDETTGSYEVGVELPRL